MHFDPILLKLVGCLLVILIVVLVTRRLDQPHVVGYLLSGIVLGPAGFGLLQEPETLARVGEFGVVLLLFFVGMETSPHRLLASWRITFIGTTAQILGSVFLMAMVGWWLNWPTSRIVLTGFVLSLSSTAVVLNYLRDSGQLKAKIGRDTLGILLAQDLALIPMLIIVGVLSGDKPDAVSLSLQVVGASLTIALVAWMMWGKHVHLPMGDKLRADHELQVFFAFGLCLGLALLTGLFHLSTALGAFLAGMLVGVARETNWVHHRLEPFRVVFVAVFFISVGLLVDVHFALENIWLILLLAIAVFVGNTAINAAVLRSLGDPWRYSIYAGAHLAQIGEFSFVLAALGAQASLISEFSHQLTVAVIALTLLLSPTWIALVGRVQGRIIGKPAELG
ncbi:MAG: cation:proton antiporter [Pseudomonadota bacterium]